MKSFPELRKSLHYLNVLVVDDEAEVLKGMKRFLLKFFDHVDEANNALEAMKKLNQNNVYDLIITDYNMPQMNGIELIKEIRKLSQDTFTVIISGSIDEIDKYSDQVEDILLKPVNIENMIKLLIKLDKLRSK